MSDDQGGCERKFLLVPAYLGSPRQRAVEWLSVCVFGAIV